MENKQLIPLEQFCAHYHIEFAFIHSLHDYGLVEITTVEDIQYLKSEQLSELEKLIRLYYELEINMEGIDAINHLLQRMNELRQELGVLKNRLRLYED